MSTLAGLFAGIDWLELKKRDVWAKGLVIPGREHEAHIWRYDAFYSLIKYEDYGNRYSANGWEFDHNPIPKWMGGSDDISNLRPLHCRNNTALGASSGLGALFTKPGR